ncbi:GumC family protein [Argonema antarcticum]|uniref:GumC family protein n=1 Tax=Argonema antarcticum TaxID=2942763 RepID=UPI002012C5EA|nr:polysaccharide biosynthesis tyrosine autokinase [Argonema antarcticum]MCL1469334.1 polysaccharide biosynthesis tyrosine autokinase [Argonema antarcticum A004/B2]
MDTNQYSQSSSSNRNSKHFQSLPQVYAGQSELSDEDKVVKELNRLFAAAQRRAMLIVGVTIVTTVGIGFLLWKRPPTYQGKFHLLVEPVTIAENKLLSVVTKTLGQTNSRTDSGLDYESQIRVLQSPKIMTPIVEQIKTKYPDELSSQIVGALTIERIMKEAEGTRILEISYKDKNADKVRFILEQVAQGYLKYSLEERQTNIRNGINFIEQQIPALQQRVDTLQGQLQDMRKQYKLTNPEVESRSLSEEALDIKTKRVEIQEKLVQNRVLYATLQKFFDTGNLTAVLSNEVQTYGTLLKQIHELENQIAQASAQFQEDSDSVQELREQENILLARSRREAVSVLQKLKGKIQGLEATQLIISQAENLLDRRINQYPAAARQYADLTRELQVATDSFTQLASKRDALRIDAAQQEVPWQLITPPQQPKREPLSRKNIILIAIMGLALGIGAAVLVEILNNVFYTPDDVEEETKLPLLAVIPFAREVRKLANKPKQLAVVAAVASLTQRASRYLAIGNGDREGRYIDSPIVEAFRSLYTNIRLLSPDKPIQSLVIGSATPGDGKSTIAVYLAQTAAAIGQRVLLVDADLRRPKIHQKLGLPNVRGLSEVISTDIGLNEVIQRSPDHENLFVLTAGSIPPDPIKQLSSEKMRHLMEQFQAFFDIVIYDAPPLVGLADANLLAAYTDGLVMVVGLEKTDRFMAIKALDGLNIAGAAVLGVVANGVKGYKTKVYKAYQRH